jgi:hypothetical protein
VVDHPHIIKKGHKYLTVVCDHLTGRVIWAAKGRSKETVGAFFDALGEKRCAELAFVSCDGAEWIRTVVAERAPEAIVCLDTFHVVKWATDALDEVRREEWNHLRRTGGAKVAKEFKGLRWLLLRNWENLSPAQKGVIRELEKANRRCFRAWQLKEELRDVMQMAPAMAKQALDDWLYFRQPLPTGAVRKARPHDPPLPGVHRGDQRVGLHERHLRVQQRRHRPRPVSGQRIPRPGELHHHDHACKSWHRAVTTLGKLTHETGRRLAFRPYSSSRYRFRLLEDEEAIGVLQQFDCRSSAIRGSVMPTNR